MRRTQLWMLLFAAGLLSYDRAAEAAILVDTAASQENSDLNPLAGFNTWAGQSFTPAQSNVAGARIGVRLRAGETVDGHSFELELRNTVNGTPILGGIQSTTEIKSDTMIFGADDFIEFTFDTPIMVTPDDTYYWAFREVNTPSSTIPRGDFLGQNPGTYAGGNSFTGMGNSSPTSFNFDYQFQTLYDSSVTAVPEPSTFFLLAVSMSAIGLRRRQR
ncbi:PEP-CTERM sorting domain-containing protein [Planctomycetes bacterium K23_9]|uniref:PEP-CTERM motif protein n=1 Tax=Stieleria marina TaxID=1930275 RepID=A0A517NQ30_9BACT|nr:PEP-CTERM motif protein [Planctomycetes bacterium K23_9]